MNMGESLPVPVWDAQRCETDERIEVVYDEDLGTIAAAFADDGTILETLAT